MSLTSAVIKVAAPLPKLDCYERFLFIGPHPDDIEIGAGATAARLAAEGKKVTFLICLDGRFGLDFAPEGTTPEELAKIRVAESKKAAEVLGVSDVRFLNFSDAGFYDVKDLMSACAEVLGEVKPQVIFAPDPCVSSECHADHLAVGDIVRRLAFFAPFKEVMEAYGAETAPVEAIAYYMTARPTRFVGTARYFEKQLEAILCHESQFPKDSEAYKSVRTYLKLRAFDFGMRSFKGKAEGFRVLGRTHMHCLPEAGR
ncbi:MAG: PIG-L family deacetylase [Lachnospiraceae bacterium]|nr:PIG-L family deacetylase [Lachnospiraceae bacterium]